MAERKQTNTTRSEAYGAKMRDKLAARKVKKVSIKKKAAKKKR
jgi:hypothetical protein